MPSTLLYPLFNGPAHLTPEEKLKERETLRKHSNNPGVRALFNLIERTAFRLQSGGIQPDADKHEQGQAYGAVYVYGIARAWLEGTEEDPEETE